MQPVVLYPKMGRNARLYGNLVQQCRDLKIHVLESLASEGGLEGG